MNLYGQSMHAIDLFTDSLLAYEMYKLSRYDERDQRYSLFYEQQPQEHNVFADNYNIGFIILVMAIFGPYIIQYSSLMSAIHNKGFFKE